MRWLDWYATVCARKRTPTGHLGGRYDLGMLLYVHGAGRSGVAAWPNVPGANAVFADLTGAVTIADKVEALAIASAGRQATVVAHSAGAVPALLALAEGAVDISSLVLLEPALYDIARGDPAIERHIAVMSTARAFAAEGDLFAYWSIVRPRMFNGPAAANNWANEKVQAEGFASIDLPWGYPVSATTIEQVPTLVVTGAWNDEYEAIAAELVRHGAVHRQLIGHQHRPQDHPDFQAMLRDFNDAL